MFYDILRKSQKFEWTPEHEKAFGELKQYLSTPPLLSKPEQGEPLYLYLSVTEADVSKLCTGTRARRYAETSILYKEVSVTCRDQIPRDPNVEVDALATLGAAFTLGTVGCIPFIHVMKSATRQNEQQNASKAATTQWTYEAGKLCTATPQEEIDDWRKPYISWLRDEVLPPNQKDARSFKMKSFRFVLIDGILFRKALAGPYLRCLSIQEAQAVMCDIHSGDCGNNTGGRSLSNKTLRQGYFWPTMRKDAIYYVKKCEECQRHAPVSHQPVEHMHPIISPWPFMKWGIDIVGLLPHASGNRMYMLAMTDYFSKWIEAEAFPQILEKHMISFIKRNIVSRYGIPSEIICDNRSQFISNRMEDYCARWNIKLFKSTPRNPRPTVGESKEQDSHEQPQKKAGRDRSQLGR
ncbi:uncharacterized protein LOC141601469 [Silene latifolia]|uniref:uncharacterized protein LOC141601469 n=1 Tax=Silene latifolia TaxID=37657 RepID=UPI003D77F4AA